MYFKQFYLGCLAHASYLIGSDGEAAVVDPQRDVEQYIAEAKAQNLRIRYIIETHIHADFVSGHRELAERTGAQIVVGRKAGATYEHLAVGENDELAVGSVRLRILETPGHTPEGISILVSDNAAPEEAPKVLTGDTLFIGDVGRPDLAGSKGFTPQAMAEMLYDSLHDKLLKLEDRVEVYPAHGAGSLCGRYMSKETWSTIGTQRATNYALQPMSKAEFVTLLTKALPDTPTYFAIDAELNRSGVPALEAISRPVALTAQQVAAMLKDTSRNLLLLDVRPSELYGSRHIRNSLNIGLDGQFASWAGTLIPFTKAVIVLAQSEADVDETVKRLARVGLASTLGYLAGGIDAWVQAGLKTVSTPQITVSELARRVESGTPLRLVDVRRATEFEAGHAPGAISMPLAAIGSTLGDLNPEQPVTLVCGSGYRSSIATSILESYGFRLLTNVAGGMTAYAEAGHPLVTPAAV